MKKSFTDYLLEHGKLLAYLLLGEGPVVFKPTERVKGRYIPEASRDRRLGTAIEVAPAIIQGPSTKMSRGVVRRAREAAIDLFLSYSFLVVLLSFQANPYFNCIPIAKKSNLPDIQRYSSTGRPPLVLRPPVISCKAHKARSLVLPHAVSAFLLAWQCFPSSVERRQKKDVSSFQQNERDGLPANTFLDIPPSKDAFLSLFASSLLVWGQQVLRLESFCNIPVVAARNDVKAPAKASSYGRMTNPVPSSWLSPREVLSFLFCLEGDHSYQKEDQVCNNYTSFVASFIKEMTLFSTFKSFGVGFKDRIARHGSKPKKRGGTPSSGYLVGPRPTCKPLATHPLLPSSSITRSIKGESPSEQQCEEEMSSILLELDLDKDITTILPGGGAHEALNLFHTLLSSQGSVLEDEILEIIPSLVTEEDNKMLTSPPNMEEVQKEILLGFQKLPAGHLISSLKNSHTATSFPKIRGDLVSTRDRRPISRHITVLPFIQVEVIVSMVGILVQIFLAFSSSSSDGFAPSFRSAIENLRFDANNQSKKHYRTLISVPTSLQQQKISSTSIATVRPPTGGDEKHVGPTHLEQPHQETLTLHSIPYSLGRTSISQFHKPIKADTTELVEKKEPPVTKNSHPQKQRLKNHQVVEDMSEEEVGDGWNQSEVQQHRQWPGIILLIGQKRISPLIKSWRRLSTSHPTRVKPLNGLNVPYPMRSIQNLENCRDDKKRRGRLAKREEKEGRGAASYSLYENFQIVEAFGTGSAFISLAETIHSIRGLLLPRHNILEDSQGDQDIDYIVFLKVL
ncbi:hypothetical protein H5410_050494 [Solanum commersonii]|uniref:Uncharacterized protein n=1 Tax=Solanum commersonii TaxID=4109 RepID=A0A9J5WVM2_SOLCO|nr:hypothetical protein H5410_050494 [Solanum commersonii]